MARRDNRFNNEKNFGVIVGGGIIIIGIIAFIISYALYSNSLQKNSKTVIDNTLVSKNNSVNMIDSNIEDASSSIGKSINEVENTEGNKMAVNTSNIDKNTESNNESKNVENVTEENASKNSENSDTNSNDTKVEEPKKDPSFAFPVSGEILKEYSKDTLIYSETLEEWTTHLGIDFKANKTEVVKASADGIVKSIKNDPRYGLTIVIEHDNGFESVYASLLSSEFVTVGEEVKKGDSIGTVGNTATFEIADETHLHFEIKQNGQSVDPSIYLK